MAKNQTEEFLMAKRLETFARENGLTLVITKTTVEKTKIFNHKTSQNKKTRWSCDLSPPLSICFYKKGQRFRTVLYPSEGTTLKNARDDLINRIRGETLINGLNQGREIHVPQNLK